MNTNQKICNACSRIIVTNEEKNNYLSIKGSICLNGWLPKQNRYSHLYLTQQRSPEDYPLFDFCDVECFKSWMYERKHQAVEALYNAYIDKVKESGENIELESFGITREDLEEFDLD